MPAAKERKIPIPRSQIEEGLLQALDAIQVNIEAYLSGTRAGWLAVGAQLFVLLCDPNPSRSLLGSQRPGTSFYPLTTRIDRPKNDTTGYLMHSPAPVSFDDGKMTVHLFDTSRPKVPMKEWLRQVIGVHCYADKGHYVTIENLIRYARKQMGPAHFDLERDTIAKALEFPQIRFRGENHPFYEWAIILIGHIVLNEVRLTIAT